MDEQDVKTRVAVAHQRITDHEDRCEERWRQAYKSMGRIETDVEKLNKRWWWLLVAVIGANGVTNILERMLNVS